MTMALNWWFHAGRSGRGAEAFTHLKRNYSLDVLWSNSWECDMGKGTWESWNGSQAVPGRDVACRHRLRPNCAECCHYVSLVSFSSAENGGNTKTNWVPLNKNPEYPKCRMEAWNYSSIFLNNVWRGRGLSVIKRNPWLLQCTEER